jgi:hypothetical protein
MRFAELQSLFQASVLAAEPSPGLLALLRPPARAESVAETFAVYHDGFRLRMAEFLANDYPALRSALGELAFGAMAEAFWRARPSTFRNARWFGASLPDFLRATPHYCTDSFVCGLAALEAALAKSFDAEDAAELPISALAATRQEDWPQLRLSFHPGVVVVETSQAALAAYEAARTGEVSLQSGGEVSLQSGGAVRLLVWRREMDVNYRVLEDGEEMALVAAMSGAPFGEICSLLAFANPQTPAEELAMAAGNDLARWFADGMVMAVAPAPG